MIVASLGDHVLPIWGEVAHLGDHVLALETILIQVNSRTPWRPCAPALFGDFCSLLSRVGIKQLGNVSGSAAIQLHDLLGACDKSLRPGPLGQLCGSQEDELLLLTT